MRFSERGSEISGLDRVMRLLLSVMSCDDWMCGHSESCENGEGRRVCGKCRKRIENFWIELRLRVSDGARLIPDDWSQFGGG